MPMKYDMFPSCIKCFSVTNFAVIERLGFTVYCLSQIIRAGRDIQAAG